MQNNNPQLTNNKAFQLMKLHQDNKKSNLGVKKPSMPTLEQPG